MSLRASRSRGGIVVVALCVAGCAARAMTEKGARATTEKGAIEALAIDIYSKELHRSLRSNEVCVYGTSFPNLWSIGFYMYDGGCIDQRFVWKGRVLDRHAAAAAAFHEGVLEARTAEQRSALALNVVTGVLLTPGGVAFVSQDEKAPVCVACDPFDDYHPPSASPGVDGSIRVALWTGVHERNGLPEVAAYTRHEVIVSPEGTFQGPTETASRKCSWFPRGSDELADRCAIACYRASACDKTAPPIPEEFAPLAQLPSALEALRPQMEQKRAEQCVQRCVAKRPTADALSCWANAPVDDLQGKSASLPDVECKDAHAATEP